MKAKQLNFFEYHDLKSVKVKYGRTIHGGLKSKGHRKMQRPLSTKKPIHLILKSDKAKGRLSFLNMRNKAFIEKLIFDKAKKFGVKIHDFANVGNHLHLKISIQSRLFFQKFLKSITALIARHVTGATRGNKYGVFWQGLAFTRVLVSHLEELYLKGYFQGNRMEASGKNRHEFLIQFRKWVLSERRNSFKKLGDTNSIQNKKASERLALINT